MQIFNLFYMPDHCHANEEKAAFSMINFSELLWWNFSTFLKYIFSFTPTIPRTVFHWGFGSICPGSSQRAQAFLIMNGGLHTRYLWRNGQLWDSCAIFRTIFEWRVAYFIRELCDVRSSCFPVVQSTGSLSPTWWLCSVSNTFTLQVLQWN